MIPLFKTGAGLRVDSLGGQHQLFLIQHYGSRWPDRLRIEGDRSVAARVFMDR